MPSNVIQKIYAGLITKAVIKFLVQVTHCAFLLHDMRYKELGHDRDGSQLYSM